MHLENFQRYKIQKLEKRVSIKTFRLLPNLRIYVENHICIFVLLAWREREAGYTANLVLVYPSQLVCYQTEPDVCVRAGARTQLPNLPHHGILIQIV